MPFARKPAHVGSGLGKDRGCRQARYASYGIQKRGQIAKGAAASGRGTQEKPSERATQSHEVKCAEAIQGALQVHRVRIPYPLGFYAKRLYGRIDDAAAGWMRAAWRIIA